MSPPSVQLNYPPNHPDVWALPEQITKHDDENHKLIKNKQIKIKKNPHISLLA